MIVSTNELTFYYYELYYPDKSFALKIKNTQEPQPTLGE